MYDFEGFEAKHKANEEYIDHYQEVRHRIDEENKQANEKHYNKAIKESVQYNHTRGILSDSCGRQTLKKIRAKKTCAHDQEISISIACDVALKGYVGEIARENIKIDGIERQKGDRIEYSHIALAKKYGLNAPAYKFTYIRNPEMIAQMKEAMFEKAENDLKKKKPKIAAAIARPFIENIISTLASQNIVFSSPIAIYDKYRGCARDSEKLGIKKDETTNAEAIRIIEKNRDSLSQKCIKGLQAFQGQTLLEDIVIHGITVPSGSLIIKSDSQLHVPLPTSHYIHFSGKKSEDQSIDVYLSKKIMYKNKDNNNIPLTRKLSFFGNRLTTAYLAQPTIIGGFKYHTPYKPVRFGKYGHISEGVLAEDSVIEVSIDEKNGEYFLRRAPKTSNLTAQKNLYHTVKIKKNSVLKLPHRKSVGYGFNSGVVAEDITLGDLTFKAGETLYVNRYGLFGKTKDVYRKKPLTHDSSKFSPRKPNTQTLKANVSGARTPEPDLPKHLKKLYVPR